MALLTMNSKSYIGLSYFRVSIPRYLSVSSIIHLLVDYRYLNIQQFGSWKQFSQFIIPLLRIYLLSQFPFTLESTGKWRVILECLNIGVIDIEFKFVDLSDYAIIHEFDPYKRSSSNIGI